MAEGLALEDTNMALFGTDIEKNLKYKIKQKCLNQINQSNSEY